MPKYLILFEKGESARWLGHLDILRTFERAIRRAALPVAFSSGFNPRERLSFANALSTGVTGAEEPALLELVSDVDPEAMAQSLNAALPPGIRIRSVERVPDAGARDVLSRLDRAVYEVVCAVPAHDTLDDALSQAIPQLLARDEISVTREREGRRKTVNIRPFLHELRLVGADAGAGRITLRMTVSIGEVGAAKPPEVVAALEPLVPGLTLRRAHRVGLAAGAASEQENGRQNRTGEQENGRTGTH